jgi:DNA-binding SARP family transcriptional activator
MDQSHKKSTLWLAHLVFLIIFSTDVYGQPRRDCYIDEIILPTVKLHKELPALLEKGYRGFIIDDHSIIDDSTLTVINDFLDQHQEEFLGFIDQEELNNGGEKIYRRFMNETINPDPDYLPKCKSVLSQGKRILFFSDLIAESGMKNSGTLSYVSADLFSAGYDFSFINNDPANLFTFFEVNSNSEEELTDTIPGSDMLQDVALRFIRRTGKIPNFIPTDDPEAIIQLKNNLPPYIKLTVIDQDGNMLTDVSFLEFENLSSKGIIHIIADEIEFDSSLFFTDNIPLTPYKNGYRFIPEIYTFNYNNYSHFKTITAKRLNIQQDLVLILPLSSKKIYHKHFPVEILGNNLTFKKDPEHKKVAYFNGVNNALYLNSKKIGDHEDIFSIALWAKPGKVQGNFPLFSKSGSYCLKIRDGSLCFTVVEIDDLVGAHSEIKKDQWQHIAITYEKSDSIHYYIDGVLTDVISAVDYNIARSGFVIATDQWDEYYEGAISGVYFWNRALGPEEVKEVYLNKFTIRNSSFVNRAILIISALIIFIVIVILIRKRGGRTDRVQSKHFQANDMNINLSESKKNHIRCFGEFAIYDNEGNNIIEGLSTKKKSFILVIFYYTFAKDGISPKVLAETFWPGYDSQRAKNVRGTYIQDIRNIVPETLLSIRYEKKKWRVLLNTLLFNDLKEVILLENLIRSGLRKSKTADYAAINRYMDIVGQGSFAKGISDDYTDSIRQEMAEQTEEMMEDLLEKFEEDQNVEFILKIADVVLKLDPIHEKVFELKMKTLFEQQNVHEAQKAYERFVKSWHQCFNEPYRTEFSEIKQKYSIH